MTGDAPLRPPRDSWQQVSALLDVAMELPAHARAEWLAALKASEPGLAAAVAGWLGEFDAMQSTGFLDARPDAAPADTPGAGMAVGPYRLIEPVGQGGMGTVWLAERSDGQFEQRVAVKLLNMALLGAQAPDRFAREAGILARLSHPQIAHLLDAGITPSGAPFLVLEYVKGEHIDRHCDARTASVRQRVGLFLNVLAPVVHAHANLIVHRDLKPSNVLVTGEGHVKLLDFGIATLLHAGDGVPHAATATREHALTPSAAAPEQLTGGTITTRTDVYALGVLLYQLLTGRHPSADASASPAALVKNILEQPVVRASDVVVTPPASPAVTAASLAALRHTTPERLRQALRGDLDTILATALKKDPAERYPSVPALYDDVRRYLRDEPIVARPDSIAYRARKFVMRHRAAVGFAAVALAALLGGLAGTITMAQRATTQARRADAEAAAATAQRDFARRQLARAEAINDLNAFLLADAAPLGSTFTARDLLTRAETILSKQHDDEPDVRAEMLVSVGRLYATLGETANASRVLTRAYDLSRGLEDRAVRAQASCGLAAVVMKAGEPARAEQLLQEGLDQLPDAAQYAAARVGCHLNATSLLNWAGRSDDAVEHAHRARAIAERYRLLSPLLDVRITMDLAEALRNAGRLPEANTAFAAAHDRLVELGREDTERAGTILNNWGLVLNSLGRPRDAERMFRRSVKISQDGTSAARVDPVLWNNLAQSLYDLGRIQEAIALSTRARDQARQAGDTVVADQALLTLARFHLASGDAAQGERLLREAETRFASMFPPTHTAFVALRLEKARLAEMRGEVPAAKAFIDEAFAMVEGNPSRRAYLTPVLRRRAQLAAKLGQVDAGRQDAERGLTIAVERAGAGNRSGSVGLAYLALGDVEAAAGRAEAARAALTSAVEHLEATVDPGHAELRRARAQLAALSAGSGRRR